MGIQKIDEVQKIETHLQLVMSRNSTRMRTLLSLIALAGSLTSMTISYRALEFNQGRIGELVDSRMVPMLEQTKRGIETSIDARFWKAFETLREERKGESR